MMNNPWAMIPVWFVALTTATGWSLVVIYVVSLLSDDDNNWPGPGPACGG